uniref:Peptidase M20 dimerisation domain-containing protein n=1 Tax=Periophthalmus magnuspinnatus TaxID=409849 RepID=A0A3B4B0Y2_9GOBI
MTDTGRKLRIVKMLKILLSCGALTLVALLTAASLRTTFMDVSAGLERVPWDKTCNISFDIDPDQRQQLLENFKEAIRIRTVSFSRADLNTSALRHFDSFLHKAFPTVFSSSQVKHELVANYSHLFWVQGSRPELEPYLLLAHIDVVPASESDAWDLPPFSAEEKDGFIYGRGTVDDKSPLMGMLQALEFLLLKGYTPQRGFYIGLGHDEEVMGNDGALNIVRVLKARGVKFLFILDEGSVIMDGILQGLDGAAAIIATTEKGSASLKLSVSMPPSHSSMPPRETTIGILASAVKRLEDNPMKRLFGQGPESGMLEHLAHTVKTMKCLNYGSDLHFTTSVLRVLFSNALVIRVMERNETTNALVRTTTAVTMFNAGVKHNVIASYAEAFVNLRIHSAHSLKEVLEFVESTIGDPRVKIDIVEGFDPLPISPYDETAFGYQLIKKTLLDLYPSVTVVPGLCIANTDSRHFKDLSGAIYRFAPLWFKPGDAQRIHGINERISKENYEGLVRFFFTLLQNCDIKKLPASHSSVHEL